MSTVENKAVFLSYASQDAAAVARIAEALRAAGVEVWFDQNELVGGDAWDQKIRKQIKDCALFVPVISAGTQARAEGYFRREWKLAVERTHDMADHVAFLVPVVIDGTGDAEAFVPEKFREVQWTRLPGGETTPRFCERVQALLRGGTLPPPRAAAAARAASTPVSVAPRARRWVPALAGVLLMAAGAWWWTARRAPEAASVRQPNVTAPAPAAVALTEAQKLTRQARALLDDDPMQLRENYFLADELAQRAVKADPADGEAWAIAGRASAIMARRKFDASAARKELVRTQVGRALSLAPNALETTYANALLQSLAGDNAAAEKMLRELVERAPTDWRLWFELGSLRRRARQFEEALGILRKAAVLARGDSRVVAEEAATLVQLMRLAEAEEVFGRALSGEPGRAAYFRRFVTLGIYLGDEPAAKRFLEQIPARMRQEDALISTVAEFFLRTGEGDRALAELKRLPRDFFEDGWDWRPKGYLAGYAHHLAGRAAAAQAEWKQSLAVVDKRLAAEPNESLLLYWKSLLQALTGQIAEAKAGRKLLLELDSSSDDAVWFDAILLVALGEREAAITSLINYWPKADTAMRNDLWGDVLYAPWLAAIRDDPRVRALAMEHKMAIERALKPAPAAVRSEEKSVAVLAFKNVGGDAANEAIVEGIGLELISVLGRVPGLTVRGNSSLHFFKGSDATAQDKGRKLNATYLVDGSVQRAGDTVRIVANLTRAATDEVVWSSPSLKRDVKDIFAVQEEMAGLIAQNLSLKLGVSSAAATAAINPLAFELYVQARQAWNLRTDEGLARAEQLLDRAIALEPNFARAHAAMADVWSIIGQRQDTFPMFLGRAGADATRVEEKCRLALKLDPDSAEAHASLGSFYWAAWRRAEGERALREAIRLNPSYASAHQWLGRVLLLDGRLEEALLALRHATELDPLSPRILDNYAWALIFAGRFTEAVQYCDRALALQPAAPQPQALKSVALAQLGQLPEAVALAQALPRVDTGYSMFRAIVFGLAGRTAELDRDLPGYDKGGLISRVAGLAAMKRYDAALEALDPTWIVSTRADYLLFHPVFDAMRGDVRFQRAIATLGLAEAHARAQTWRAAHPLPTLPTKP